MEGQNNPLFVMFEKHTGIANEAFEHGEHQKAMVHMLIAAFAAAAAGTADSKAAAALIVNVYIPQYTEEHNVNMDGVDMPDGWREELIAASFEADGDAYINVGKMAKARLDAIVAAHYAN